MKFQTDRAAAVSDDKIIELFWQRDEKAIKETDIKYISFLMSIAYNIVHDRCDCEECLNDTYIGAWNSIPPARPKVLKAFLATIMRRIAINRFNANKCQKRISSELIVSLSELEDLMACDYDMQTEIESEELAKIISDYVRSLPNKQMYIFVSRYYIADPLVKISKELGCSVSTVKRELTAIKNGLKKKLESEGYNL